MRFFIITAFLAATAFGQAYHWDYVHEMSRREFARPASGLSSWPNNGETAKDVSREHVVVFLTGSGIVKKAEDVYDFRFVSLAPGKLYLVAVLDGGGTQGVNWIDLIHCDDKRCTGDSLHSDPEIDLSEQLVSVAGNEIFQLVTHEGSRFYMYEMGDNGPHEVSRKYRDWYNQYLYPKMEQAIKEGPPIFASEVDDLGFVAAFREADGQYTMDEYRERVLSAKDAPMQHALRWANSPYARIQDLAIGAVQWAEDSKLVSQVLDALEKSHSEQARTSAIEMRKERAERKAEKEVKQ